MFQAFFVAAFSSWVNSALFLALALVGARPDVHEAAILFVCNLLALGCDQTDPCRRLPAPERELADNPAAAGEAPPAR